VARPQRILIVPDKFKGTLTAQAAAEAMGTGWRWSQPDHQLDLLPMSDGGDGFGGVVSRLLGDSEVRHFKTIDAAHAPCWAHWWWAKQGLVVVESASVIGLAMLPTGRYHPFELDSAGLGFAMKKAAAAGARRCLIGLGGSATNDGGFGLARALGWRFIDSRGYLIERWIDLGQLARIEPPAKPLRFRDVTAVVDVRNPLLSRHGATRVFGPQKGLRPGELERAERCLARLAKIVGATLGRDCSVQPGAGAAGGLGFGLAAFLRAHLQDGFEFFARLARLDERIRRADLVITGEGALDHSTLMGKGVGRVAERCRALDVPCLVLAGTIRRGVSTAGFARARCLTELTDAADAKARAAFWLEHLAFRAAQDLED
jgi:glycerate kinase